VDVFSTEEWALDMIPQPVLAVLLLYPLTDKLTQGEDKSGSNDAKKDVWFMKQRIGNACGTIGLLHVLLNNQNKESFQDQSWLQKFSEDCPVTMDPVAKAERLEGDMSIAQFHDEATSSSANATDRGNLDDDVITHFVGLVNVRNTIYELDGRKEGPVPHGPTSQETFLKDAMEVVQTKFMAKDPTELRFTMTALAPKQNGAD
jgi:ubiquitin carboxyl-terminal hydrolase L3